MEKMPFEAPVTVDAVTTTVSLPERVPAANDWRTGLPTLIGTLVTLRELQLEDAPSLFASLTSEEASRFISPPPTGVDGFERFIAWAHRQREAGRCMCFAVVARTSNIAIGLFQIRSLEPDFMTAEWGFALAREFWGTGAFIDGATLTLDYAFTVIGSHRLEARAAVMNGRGNGALRKLGARREGLLRKSFLIDGEYLDQLLWTIISDDWLQTKATWGAVVIH
ncbi:MAG TPA: GNAT family N-acetyltransferase [Vicinamibacterales bacterium]|nr:GNAT family N-acetyltransferase [Vicinamibacterales bacterium]